MAKKVEKKKDNKDEKKATSKTSNTTKKSGTSMKKTEMEKNKKQSEKEKDKKKKTQTTQASSNKSSDKKSKSDKNSKTTAEKDSSEKKNKKIKPTNKPKTKKDYEEDDELLDEEELDDEEDNQDEFEEEIEDEEVAEVEEIDLSNIEPVIDPVLEDEEEEEYVPKTRGRKKQAQPEQHHQLTMEEIIRNRPLQIDPTQKVYVTKKEDEPQPYIAPEKTTKERYSDKELQEFKEIILQKLHETRENYEQLKKYFTHQDAHGTDDTSPTFKMIEDGSEVMTKEEIEQQLARLEKYMIDLQNALLRIENKTYGICTVTGKLIPKERLRSVPHATKSIEAKINRD